MDTSYNLYHRPVNRFVAISWGGRLLPGTVRDADSDQHRTRPIGQCGCFKDVTRPSLKRLVAVCVLLRPDDVTHDDASDSRPKWSPKHFAAPNFSTPEAGQRQRVLSLVPSHHNHALASASASVSRRSCGRLFRSGGREIALQRRVVRHTGLLGQHALRLRHNAA